MTEQDMSLDTAIQLFHLVQTFDEYEEGLREVLTRVHTQEELDKAKEIIDKKKQHLMETNPDFKAVMNQRKTSARMQADYDRALHRATMAESNAEAATARADARAQVRSALSDEDIGEWVAKTRVKTVDPEMLERKSKEELYCPICRQKDTSRNIVNNYPTCMIDMHRLVPKSELKNYPRSYRRAWKRGKKRK